MRILTPEEQAMLQRVETVDVALQQGARVGGIVRGLQSGSYPNEESGNGYYDDDTNEWHGYLRYDIDAYNSGKGMAP